MKKYFLNIKTKHSNLYLKPLKIYTHVWNKPSTYIIATERYLFKKKEIMV
jgi:hypothetical protein